MCPSPTSAGQSGGVNISATIGTVAGSIVGGNVGLNAEELVAALDAKGVLLAAELAGLQRETIIKLAQRLKPDDALDFNQAVRELERAVAVALDVIARGERGTNHDEFVNAVLAQVAEKTRIGDLDGGQARSTKGSPVSTRNIGDCGSPCSKRA